jgi:hypothetical protein
LNSALLLPVLLLTLACQTDPSLLGTEDTSPAADTLVEDGVDLTGADTTDPKDGAIVDDTGDTVDPGDTSGDTTDIGGGESLFQDKVVLQFDLTIDATDWKALLDGILDCKEDMCGATRQYVPGGLTFHNPWTKQDEKYTDVAIRWRGNSSACQPDMNPRIGFKISFNEYQAGRRFHGQKKLNFLGTEGDASLMREVIAFEGMKKFGLPAAKVGYAWVRVNGGPGQLHPLVQESDDSPYIEEVLGETEKGSYFKVDGYCGRPEFDEWEEGVLPDDLTRIWEPKAGTLPEAMTTTLIPMLKCFSYEVEDDFKTCFEETVDRDLWLRAMAIELCMPDDDGFAIGGKNHSLYFRKSDNKAVVVMWDKDASFRDSYCTVDEPFWCIPPWIVTVPAGIDHLAQIYGPNLDGFMILYASTVMADGFLPTRIEHWYDLIAPYAAQDQDITDHTLQWYWEESVQVLRDYILQRRADILDAVGE